MTILYFILAAIGLGILVFVHELGHYFVAKKTGMIVEIFSIGFGKPILKWRWNNVNWQLGWLPFGGYVRIAGMEFGKKDKFTYNNPYEVPNGFFSKSPWKRIFVACAGPLANFILAFLIFALIWGLGGREKSFSEFSHIIGWVDPQSELYAYGLRPGDLLTSYNGKRYTNAKDLIYAAMLSGKTIELSGYHVDYLHGTKNPFTYKIQGYHAAQSPEGILTTGITTPARYLIYDRLPDGSANPLPEGSPMEDSGIEYQDRLIWADGEYLFSMEQLSHILNEGKALITVKRKEEIFLTRQPRVQLGDLIVPPHVKNEMCDWQYEMCLKGRSQELYMLPYIINGDGYVEAPLNFIDSRDQEIAFPHHPYSSQLEQPLVAGDQIIGVDGMSTHKGYQILQRLQQRHVQLMVQKHQTVLNKNHWQREDQHFFAHIDEKGMTQLSQAVGTSQSDRVLDDLALLGPVIPKPIIEFVPTQEVQQHLREVFEKQREAIESIRDPAKRGQALKELELSRNKLLLGIYLQDKRVDYNPTPWSLFSNVFTETWYTLEALVKGYLNPKWISGPVGIVQVLHHGWQVGVKEALFWLAAISVNLGFLNLLPIPVLDGGYICLSLWELMTRRRLQAKTMERLVIPFVVLLIGLFIFLTFQDIVRLFS